MQESILDPENDDSATLADVATRIAHRTLTSRSSDYSSEVRRLLDAGREVMRARGTSGKARVADVVAAADLSNDAFYRHFRSKDELVTAILEDGTVRLCSYLGHQMAKGRSPESQIRRWVEGILSQAIDEDIAATTLAVLWNAGGTTSLPGRSFSTPLASLLVEPFTALGREDPGLDARLAAHAVVGRLSDHLWSGTRPTPSEATHITESLLR